MSDRLASGFCLSEAMPGAMRWYGWGSDSASFDPRDRPRLWPYVTKHLGITSTDERWQPIDEAVVVLPIARKHEGFLDWLGADFAPDFCSTSPGDRLRHAYGRSTSDIWRLRQGLIDQAPDCVVFPTEEQQVVGLIRAAQRFGVVLIPFGGGSNVAGCLDATDCRGRMVVSVDLRRMNKVLEIDAVSGLVNAEAGILGPALEAALEHAGLTLGHFPDSFPFSTLGGWVATRSSGMLSDGYGSIEDMVIALRIATPAGVLETRRVPHASNGPDVKRLVIGSEGTLGIITSLTMRVRPRPAIREFRGYLFPDFPAGLNAIGDGARLGVSPTMMRLNDPAKTQLSSAFRRGTRSAVRSGMERLIKFYLSRGRHFDLARSALLIAAFEGDASQVRKQRSAVEPVWRRFGAVALGRGPGRSLEDSKFDLPYIRDFLMDFNVIADVAETCVLWRNIRETYRHVMDRAWPALSADGRQAWLGCHVSHCYSSGASLYFSFAFRCSSSPDSGFDRPRELAHYRHVKKVLLDTFAECGATLSHHHAVGREHLPWLRAETAIGHVMPVQALKAAIDPDAIMNPGKLVDVAA
jgi:alkyldihydroxyacetonephosphate synthase